jgi:hypothetical protein
MDVQKWPKEDPDFLQYPLNSARGTVDAHNLRLYSKELERRSAMLFVQSPEDCSIELWQVGLGLGDGELCIGSSTSSLPLEPHDHNVSVKWISSVSDLKKDWKVSHFILTCTSLLNERRGACMANEQAYCIVSPLEICRFDTTLTPLGS